MIEIAGEAGHVLTFVLDLTTSDTPPVNLIDGNTITSVQIGATGPDGVTVYWTASIDAQSTDEISVSYTLTEQLAANRWELRPFLFTGSSVLVRNVRIPSREIQVTPSDVPPPP